MSTIQKAYSFFQHTTFAATRPVNSPPTPLLELSYRIDTLQWWMKLEHTLPDHLGGLVKYVSAVGGPGVCVKPKMDPYADMSIFPLDGEEPNLHKRGNWDNIWRMVLASFLNLQVQYLKVKTSDNAYQNKIESKRILACFQMVRLFWERQSVASFRG